MKKIFYFHVLIAFLLGVAVCAQDTRPDAVYRKLVREYTLNPDGSSDFRLYKEVVLNTHYSFHRQQGETFIVYNPEYQDLKINEAYTIMADGMKVVTPENAFNEVLPRFAARVPAYNHLREMVVTHTGLEVGAVIHLDYSIHTKADFMPAFMGDETLWLEVPVTEMNLVVRVPEKTGLKQRTYNIRTAPETRNEGGMTIYTWTFRDLKAMPHDSHMDPTGIPRVVFSSVDMKRAFFRMVAQPAFTFQAGPGLSRMAKEAVEGEKDDIARIMKLKSMVNSEFNTWNVPEHYTGYRCRTPDEVWKSNGGTPLEKAVLLSTLLMEAGINTRPVAVFPGMFYDPAIACLGCIDSYIVQANPREEEQWYVSPTSGGQKNLKYELSGKTMLVLDGAIESLKTYNEPQQAGEVTLGAGLVIHDTTRITGTMTLELSRQFNPYFQLQDDKANAASLVTGVSKPGIEIRKINQHKALIEYELELEKPFETFGEYAFLSLPASREGLSGWHTGYLPAERNSPFLVPDLIHETCEYSVSYPENMELVTPLKNTELDYSFGKLLISMKQKKQEIFIRHEIEIREKEISQADYDSFRDMINIWEDGDLRKLVFKFLTY